MMELVHTLSLRRINHFGGPPTSKHTKTNVEAFSAIGNPDGGSVSAASGSCHFGWFAVLVDWLFGILPDVAG